MIELGKIHLGDCLDHMREMPDKSIDLILTDPPYNSTDCEWEWDIFKIISQLWEQFHRIGRENCSYVFTGAQPFTSRLVCSNIPQFRHHWVWDKVKPTGFQIAKYRPMMRTEDVVVFQEDCGVYNPIMTPRKKIITSRRYGASKISPLAYNDGAVREYSEYYPENLLQFSNGDQSNRMHPTQKPIDLFMYLIKTYSFGGDLIYDPFMGSGTTAVACERLGRRWIGSEISEEYIRLANKRIEAERAQFKLAL